MLTYELLKQNVAKVEILKDLNMGDYTYLYDDLSQINKENFEVDENNELIIKKGQIALINVQPHNYHYELTFNNGEQIDVCFDDDEQLNEYLKFIKFEGKNPYFNKEN